MDSFNQTHGDLAPFSALLVVPTWAQASCLPQGWPSTALSDRSSTLPSGSQPHMAVCCVCPPVTSSWNRVLQILQCIQ